MSGQEEGSQKKATMKPVPDGPFIYQNEVHPEGNVIYDSRDEKISCGERAALCRCGGSADKVFCDGTHAKIGFSGARESDGHLDKRRDYVGKRIAIHDNRSVCSHALFCVHGLPEVFKVGSRPWIDPDGAEPEDIIAVIEKCPSGALSYSVDGVEQEDPVRAPVVTLTRDGLVGGIEVEGEEPWAEGVSREHCCCCRCGASKNKPFCDGSHLEVGFEDDRN